MNLSTDIDEPIWSEEELNAMILEASSRIYGEAWIPNPVMRTITPCHQGVNGDSTFDEAL
jgi:hypothetical protein